MSVAKDPTIYEPKYWDRPEPSENGDPNGELIFKAIGYALSSWEQADQALSTLFLVLTECKSAATALAIQRAYGSIASNTGRRDAVRAVGEVFFGELWEIETVKKPLSNIITAVQKASHRRDDITHGIVSNVTFGRTDRGTFLFPPEYNTGRTYTFMPSDDKFGFTKAKYRYTGDNINMFAAKFNLLKREIYNYVMKISNKKYKPDIIREFSLREGKDKTKT